MPSHSHRALEQLTVLSKQYIADIVAIAVEHHEPDAAVIVLDKQCELAQIIGAAYVHCLPNAQVIDFDNVTPEFILSTFDALKPRALVVLIQSTNFRLEAFRIRVELFKKQLKVIEHPHLARMTPEQYPVYIASLAYDPNYYRTVGKLLKDKIDNAQRGVVFSGNDCQLVFDGGFEPAKLNIGDYSDMTNIGGQFPIGEVFTEARDLEAVHGRVRIFIFGDTTFTVNQPPTPITLIIEQGRIVDVENSTTEFDLVLQKIREDEGQIWVRVLGLGMNRAFTKDQTVNDIGTYERMCGVHLSLGAKHGVYNKPQIRRATAKYHVDVFAVTESVQLDDNVIYKDGAWIV